MTLSKPLLIQAALSASRSEKHPEIFGKKQTLQKRRGKKKAIIAIARRLLTAIYHILSKGEAYDPSAYRKEDKPPWFARFLRKRHLRCLQGWDSLFLIFLPRRYRRSWPAPFLTA